MGSLFRCLDRVGDRLLAYSRLPFCREITIPKQKIVLRICRRMRFCVSKTHRHYDRATKNYVRANRKINAIHLAEPSVAPNSGGARVRHNNLRSHRRPMKRLVRER